MFKKKIFGIFGKQESEEKISVPPPPVISNENIVYEQEPEEDEESNENSEDIISKLAEINNIIGDVFEDDSNDISDLFHNETAEDAVEFEKEVAEESLEGGINTIHMPAASILSAIPAGALVASVDDLIAQNQNDPYFVFSFTQEDVSYGLSMGELEFSVSDLVSKISVKIFSEAASNFYDEKVSIDLVVVLPLVPPSWFSVGEQDASQEEMVGEMEDLFPSLSPPVPEKMAEEAPESPAEMGEAEIEESVQEPEISEPVEAKQDLEHELVVSGEPEEDELDEDPDAIMKATTVTLDERKPEPEPVAEEPSSATEIPMPVDTQLEQEPVQEIPEDVHIAETPAVPEQPVAPAIPPEPVQLPVTPEPVLEAPRVPLQPPTPPVHPAVPPSIQEASPQVPSGLEKKLSLRPPTTEDVAVPPVLRERAANELDSSTADVESIKKSAAYTHPDADDVRHAAQELLVGDGGHEKIEVAEKSVGKRDAATGEVALWKSHAPNGIDINLARVDELCLLNRVGEHLAQSIIDYRKENGKFGSLQEMLKIPGLGNHSFRKMTKLGAGTDVRAAELQINKILGIDSEVVSLMEVVKIVLVSLRLNAIFISSIDGLILAKSTKEEDFNILSESLAAVAPQLYKRAKKALNQGELPAADMYTFYIGKNAVTFAGSDQLFVVFVHGSDYPDYQDLKQCRKLTRELVWYCSYRAVIS